MDDAKSSEKKYKESTKQICTLAYPILDGSGKQFNIQYSKSIPSDSTFPTLLTKIPISRSFKSYQEYSYITKKWYTMTKALFSQYILPSNLSLFYRRPLKSKTLKSGKKLMTYDQFLKTEEILINELKFDDSTFFKSNIKSKSNLVSEYISYTNKWPGWLIPPFPEPNFYKNIEDFIHAASNWYQRCTEILNENVNNFISQTNENNSSNFNYLSCSFDNRFIHHRISHRFFNSKKENPNNLLSDFKSLPYQINSNTPNNNESSDNNNDIDDQKLYVKDLKYIDKNNNNYNASNDDIRYDFINVNDSNNFYDNNYEKFNTGNSVKTEINVKSNIFNTNTDIDQKLPISKFDFLLHPISFHDKYDIKIVQNNNDLSMIRYKNNLNPIKTLQKSFFLDNIQSNTKCKFDTKKNSKENISNTLKKMNFFHQQYTLPFSIKNPIVGDFINNGCFSLIRNSYPVPIFENENENEIHNDDFFTQVRKNLYLLDLDKNQISQADCYTIFQYVISNHSNELFQNLLNNTQFLYKIAVVLSFFIPSSSSFQEIQIIQPFDENDDFLSIDDYDEILQFSPDVQFKLDLREIHGLLFQWHFSDVIYRIFCLIQNESNRIEEAAKYFMKRSEFYRNAFKKFTEKKIFPFSFLTGSKIRKKSDIQGNKATETYKNDDQIQTEKVENEGNLNDNKNQEFKNYDQIQTEKVKDDENEKVNQNCEDKKDDIDKEENQNQELNDDDKTTETNKSDDQIQTEKLIDENKDDESNREENQKKEDDKNDKNINKKDETKNSKDEQEVNKKRIQQITDQTLINNEDNDDQIQTEKVKDEKEDENANKQNTDQTLNNNEDKSTETIKNDDQILTEKVNDDKDDKENQNSGNKEDENANKQNTDQTLNNNEDKSTETIKNDDQIQIEKVEDEDKEDKSDFEETQKSGKINNDDDKCESDKDSEKEINKSDKMKHEQDKLSEKLHGTASDKEVYTQNDVNEKTENQNKIANIFENTTETNQTDKTQTDKQEENIKNNRNQENESKQEEDIKNNRNQENESKQEEDIKNNNDESSLLNHEKKSVKIGQITTQNDNLATITRISELLQDYAHVSHSCGDLKSLASDHNSSLSQFSNLMSIPKLSKTTDSIPVPILNVSSNSSENNHIKKQRSFSSQNLNTIKTNSICKELKDPKFIELVTSIYKVCLLYDVPTFVCQNSFIFLKFISINDDEKSFKKFTTELLFNRKMCTGLMKDFMDNKLHLWFNMTDSLNLVHFLNLLFNFDIREMIQTESLKIDNFEWSIQFFQHVTRYLLDSYSHVILIENILRFIVHSIDSENSMEWSSNVKTLQGLLYAFIPYEKDYKMLSSELRSFALLMKSNLSFVFFNSSEKIENIFQFLTFTENCEVLNAAWKILRALFVYQSDNIASYIQKFETLYIFIQKAIMPLKNLNDFTAVACELLNLISKLIEVAFPSEFLKGKSSRSNIGNYRNYFAFLNSKNVVKGLHELLRILGENQIRPNYLCFTIKNCLKMSKNSSFTNYIKVIERYEVAVSSRPTIKKMFTNYNIDFEIKMKKIL